MPNYLKMPKKSQVLALLELGWSYRRIEAETGVRRETSVAYDRTRRQMRPKRSPAPTPRHQRNLPIFSRRANQMRPKRSPGRPANPAKTFPGSRGGHALPPHVPDAITRSSTPA